MRPVHREFLGANELRRPALAIKWDDERDATVTLGAKKYPGKLFDLPTINETYKMASKVSSLLPALALLFSPCTR